MKIVMLQKSLQEPYAFYVLYTKVSTYLKILANACNFLLAFLQS